jgi:hypothetical protein
VPDPNSETTPNENEQPSPPSADQDTLKTHLLIGMTASMTMMAEKVGELSVATRVLTRRVEQGDEERDRDRRWFKLACVVVLAAFLLGGIIVWDNHRSVRDTAAQGQNTAAALAILQRVTGPEATAEQNANTQKAIDRIVATSDCNDEENLREIVSQLKDVLPNVKVPAERPECAIIRKQQESTSTTNP